MKVLAGIVLAVLVGLMAFPMLFAGGDSAPLCSSGSSGSGTPPVASTDHSPTILGPSALTASQLTRWWSTKGKGQPPRLAMPINDLVAAYLDEGDREGVRGDLAFAQAVLETGWFTNADTSINNFAGIGHYDTASSGFSFPSPAIGVRAQIQLLKKYVDGNAVALASPDVSPNAGARASTWSQLATRWATAPDYWTKLDSIYSSMSGNAATSGPSIGGCSTDEPTVVGRYALPVARHWFNDHPDWFNHPHQGIPADDIPVPTGTPVFSASAGTVLSAPVGGDCGLGVTIAGDDGANYTYCHGSDGGQIVHPGDHVDAGTLVMHSASTGNSTGPHLHFGIRVAGQNRCPQAFLVALGRGQEVSPESLPITGCVS